MLRRSPYAIQAAVALTPTAPPAISAIFPSLGDVDGMIPFKIIGSSLANVTGITIGGVAATGIVNVSTGEVHGYTPALVAGLYDVIVTTGVGSSPPLVNGFESWDANQIVAPAVAHVYDSEQGITQAVPGQVSAWADQGAGANNLLQAVAGLQPLYIAKRFGDGLRHGLSFDGVNDVLALAAPIAFANNRSIFCAVKWNTVFGAGTCEIVTGNSAAILDYAFDGTGGIVTMRTFDANAGINRRSPNDPNLCSGVSPVPSAYGGGSARLLGQLFDGNAGLIHFYQNNTQDGPDVAVTVAPGNWNAVGAGAGNVCSGEIGAVVVTEGLITAADRAKLTTWMWGKWLARGTNYSRLNDNTPWFARDGAGLVAIGDTVYMLGGWNAQAGGQFPAGKKVTNEVWRSVDRGVNWSLIKANEYTPAAGTFWTPRHTAGWVKHTVGSIDYLYVLGSDIYNGPQNNVGTGVGTSDVWRSTDGITWEEVTSTAPWGPRVVHMCASFQGSLFVMGGMTDVNNPATVLQDVWRSDDGGFTWTNLGNAPWAGRGFVNSGQGLPVFNGKLWLMGGGNYTTILYNDVWSFDGTAWVLVNAAATWAARQYNSTFVFLDKLWVSNGVSDFIGTNIGDAWASPDGVTWTQETFTPWRPSHADGAVAISDRVVVGPGNGQIGQPIDPGTGKVFDITRLDFVHP
jgi:IPT/TIG domain-containing protein